MEVLNSMFTKGLPFSGKIIYSNLVLKNHVILRVRKGTTACFNFCYILQKGVTVVYDL